MPSKTHGMTDSPEYRSWQRMKERCSNPRADSYHRYGGSGIKVCDLWIGSFEAFLADMGPRPSLNHSIDRTDNERNYEPGNCRWATRKEQNRNQRSNRIVELGGERISLAEAAERAGVEYFKARDRLNRGWSVDRALEGKEGS